MVVIVGTDKYQLQKVKGYINLYRNSRQFIHLIKNPLIIISHEAYVSNIMDFSCNFNS